MGPLDANSVVCIAVQVSVLSFLYHSVVEQTPLWVSVVTQLMVMGLVMA